jgi:hypothetical protein
MIMNQFITDAQLDEIDARARLATAGPWKSYIERRDHLSGSSFIMTGSIERRGPDIELSGATLADQDFIASSRQDVPNLVNEVRRLRALLVGVVE